MKKLAFLFVAASAISFVSCGNGTQATETVQDSDTVVVEDTIVADTIVADTTAADTTVAE